MRGNKPRKIYIQHCTKGVKFLGAVIKPNRIYIANRTKGNFYDAIEKQNAIARDHKPTQEEQEAFLSSMNSYLGIIYSVEYNGVVAEPFHGVNITKLTNLESE